LSAHLRTFADYMVYELNLSGVSGQNINKVCYSISRLQSLAFHSWDFFGFIVGMEGVLDVILINFRLVLMSRMYGFMLKDKM
jgi:hypothetical protein